MCGPGSVRLGLGGPAGTDLTEQSLAASDGRCCPVRGSEALTAVQIVSILYLEHTHLQEHAVWVKACSVLPSHRTTENTGTLNGISIDIGAVYIYSL